MLYEVITYQKENNYLKNCNFPSGHVITSYSIHYTKLYEIDDLFEEIDNAKNASQEQKEDLEELREMRTECYAIVEELNRNELEDDEIEELLAELIDMRNNFV